ncbi:MAG: hypothetical protein JXA19_02850 [Anaerolineales bacterium]|nr:hypothetical protein [Anaerolineales bacterium]
MSNNSHEDRLLEIFSNDNSVKRSLIADQQELKEWIKKIQVVSGSGKSHSNFRKSNDDVLLQPDENAKQIKVQCSYCKHEYHIPETLDIFICIHCLSKFSIIKNGNEYLVRPYVRPKTQDSQENNRHTMSRIKNKLKRKK